MIEIKEKDIAGWVNKNDWHEHKGFEVKLGSVFKSTLKINSKYIEWKDLKYPIESIESLTWNATKTSFEGIFDMSAVYNVGFNDVLITFQKTFFSDAENLFMSIVRNLWNHAGPLVMFRLLQQLREGKKLRIGNVEIDDAGVVLEKYVFLFPNELLHHKWPAVSLGCGNGSFVIQAKDETSFRKEIAYSHSNAHPFEFIINASLKNNLTKLSDLLSAQ